MNKLLLVISCFFLAACNCEQTDCPAHLNTQQPIQKKTDTSLKGKSSGEVYLEKRAREKVFKAFGVKDYSLEYDWQYQQKKKLMKDTGLDNFGWCYPQRDPCPECRGGRKP